MKIVPALEISFSLKLVMVASANCPVGRSVMKGLYWEKVKETSDLLLRFECDSAN